jgi:hypothetical protein
MLLAFLGAALVQNILSSRAALRRFGAIDAATSASADSIGGEGGRSPSLGVNFSLWDEKRIQAHSTSLTKDFDTPLAVLRIPKMRDTSPYGVVDSKMDKQIAETLARGMRKMLLGAGMDEDDIRTEEFGGYWSASPVVRGRLREQEGRVFRGEQHAKKQTENKTSSGWRRP